jgi:hypothetical protein
MNTIPNQDHKSTKGKISNQKNLNIVEKEGGLQGYWIVN